MPRPALLLLVFLTGCALDDPYEPMAPLPGAGETPTIRNRFPDSRGGFSHSRADKTDAEMTPVERLQQY